MTNHDKTPRETGRRSQADHPHVPDPRPGDRDMREMTDPYDLPFPDRWPPGRPQYGWKPATGTGVAPDVRVPSRRRHHRRRRGA